MPNRFLNTRAKRAAAAMAVFLCCLPLAQALAGSQYLLLSSWSGPPGSSVTVQGFGFTAGQTAHVTFQGLSADATVANDGSFTTSAFSVPTRPGGSYPFSASDAAGESATAPFYIQGAFPSITPGDWWLAPGQKTSVHVDNFAPNETINITDPNNTLLGSFAVGANGSGDGKNVFAAPFNAAGKTVTITFTGQTSGASAAYPLQVGNLYAFAVPSAYYLTPGQTLGVSGGGFAPNETLDLMNGTTKVTTFTADASGNFNVANAVTIGFSMNGTQTYHVTGESSGASSGNFSVSIGGIFPTAVPTAYYATPGQTVGVTATNFGPNEVVDLFDAGKQKIASATADAQGNIPTALKTAITVPYGSASNLTYMLVGETSKASTSFSFGVGGLFPQAVPVSYFVQPGGTNGVTATNFGANEVVDLFDANNQKIGSATADASGNIPTALKTAISVPFSAKGSLNYTLTGETSKASANFSFSVGGFDPQIDPSGWYLAPRQTFTITGRGYGPTETIDIAINKTVVTHVTTDANGNFTASTRAAGSGATFTVSATGEQSGGNVSKTIGLNVACEVD